MLNMFIKKLSTKFPNSKKKNQKEVSTVTLTISNARFYPPCERKKKENNGHVLDQVQTKSHTCMAVLRNSVMFFKIV